VPRPLTPHPFPCIPPGPCALYLAAVEEIRETEDGVNRALLMSAVEEVKRLKTRVTVLEGEAARHRVQSSGYFSFGGGGGDGGVDSQQMAKLTTELARLEEDNGRQKWMIGEKDKQVKEVQGKYQVRACATAPTQMTPNLYP